MTGVDGALSAEQQGALARLHERRPAFNLVGFAFVGLWAASSALTLRMPGVALKLPWIFLSGVALHALGILMHEGVHGKLFASAALNRWIGFLCSAPVFVAGSAYRAYHLPHHRAVRSASDPDEFENVTRRPAWLKILLVLWLLVGTFWYLVYLPVTGFRMGNRESRRAILEEYALMLLLYGLAFALVPLRILAEVWLLPFLFTALFAQLRGFTEHIFTAGDAPARAARTITSSRLVSFLMLNLNYHLDHHLYPAVPWYNIPRLHELLRDELRRADAPVSSSYLAFLWEVVKAFPRSVPRPAEGPGTGYYLHYMPVLPPRRPRS